MIQKEILTQLKPIISDPAWKEQIVSRLRYILEMEDRLFHKSKADDFRYYQGRYDQAKDIYELFSKPENLADDGVKVMAAPHEPGT